MTPQREKQLRDLIHRRAKSPAIFELGPDEDLVDRLRLDSLTSLEVLASIEKAFDLQFPDDQLHELRTLQRIGAEIDSWEAEFGQTGAARCESD